MRVLFLAISILIFLTGCFSDNLPVWVNKINSGSTDLQSNSYCFYDTEKGGNVKKLQDEIRKNILSQIAQSITSNVKSDVSVYQSVYNSSAQKYVSIKTDISSSAALHGIVINNFYYDKKSKTMYGYKCIPQNSYNLLLQKAQNLQRFYADTILQIQKAINNSDKQKAENLLNILSVKFPEFKNSPTYRELKSKINAILNVQINIPKKILLLNPLPVKILTNKNIYVDFVLKVNGDYYYLGEFIALQSSVNKFNLKLPLQNPADAELIVYYGLNPLNLNRYVLNDQGKLSSGFEDSVSLQNISKSIKKIKIVNMQRYVLCIKADNLTELLKQKLGVLFDFSCKKYDYLVQIKTTYSDAGGFVSYITISGKNMKKKIFVNQNIDKSGLKTFYIPYLSDKIKENVFSF